MSPTASDPLYRNAVKVHGTGARTLMFAHGFGCNQTMWRHLIPFLQDSNRLVLFDYTGFGASDADQFDRDRYAGLDGYVRDVIDICGALDLRDVTFVGHSVSSMIGLLAAIERPGLFRNLVMICPSPSFVNELPEYPGGFEREDLEELIELVDRNAPDWATYLAPIVMGAGNDPALTSELRDSFAGTDPGRARVFARATFLSDCRNILPQSPVPALLLQSLQDNLAAPGVGAYMHKKMPQSRLETLDTIGHCMHMASPARVADLINGFVQSQEI
ncbi:alpha/beta hydrolase [Roseobacter sp.]|uniref:alpha/beta fold hydrolase n=1 Tax=Roseobacter sp. TaxID=1907202 RepID=UPI0025DCE796|nr:alpha/beta hydrolase [Roseobacter sp.]